MVMDDTKQYETDKIEEVLENQTDIFSNPDIVEEDELFTYDKNGDRKKKPVKKDPAKAKLDKVAISFYGEHFDGYQRIDEYRMYIPAFKELFYQRRLEDEKITIMTVLREFNETLFAEFGFRMFPYTSQVKAWRIKWEKDILQKKGMKVERYNEKRNVRQVLKTRASGDNGIVEYVAPTHEDLEQATQTLGGELLNDALQMLKDDQEMDEIYESDELIKRKNHVVNVFAHVTKLVHGKAALLLKASQEKRENAGFMMDLMRKATSGKVDVEEIRAMRAPYEKTPFEKSISQ